jgi:hypothetical protein
MKDQKTASIYPYLICLIMSMALGAAVALINPGRSFFNAWLGGMGISFICLVLLYISWKWVKGGTMLAVCMVLAFLLRIILGSGLTLSLPVWGYEEESSRHGYSYLDAYHRDTDAWRLAQSNNSLVAAFGVEFASDQYGGLLSLSAGIYRVFSPDAHRPILILLLTAFSPAIGVPFLWKAIRKRWNHKLATLATWVFALYPESIMLSSAQMREPFLIGLSAIAFFGVVEWSSNHRTSILAILLSMAGIAFFSSKAAIAIFVLLAIWFWFDNIFPNLKPPWHKVSWLLIGLIVVIAIMLSLNWLINSSRWDLYLMEASSGRIQFELDAVGSQYRIPFIVSYGLLQPVISAAIAYPSIALMRAIAIFRAIGWWVIMPTLVFAFFAVWRIKPNRDRRVLICFVLAIVLWVLISSVRAGGDQWDNVRYRAIFTTWIAFIASWGYLYAKENKSPWLGRILMVEAVFVLVFLQWYLSRYYLLFGRLRFWSMIFVIIVLSTAILLGGWFHDHQKKKLKKSG